MTGTPQNLAAVKMPQNLEAERALLGSLIMDNRLIEVALNIFPGQVIQQAMTRQKLRSGLPEVEPLFFSASHQIIFGATCRLCENSHEITLVTLSEELIQCGQLDSIGGASYLAELLDDIFALEQVGDLAVIVLEKWRLRCLIRATLKIAHEASASDKDAEQLIGEAEKGIFDITLDSQNTGFIHVGRPMTDLLTEIEQRSKKGSGMPGLETGFKGLDAITGGLRAGEMTVLAARPSMGKTAFALNIASHVTLRQNCPVGIFSLEMSKKSLLTRLVCTEAGVSMSRVNHGQQLRRDEIESLSEASSRIYNSPLHIDDSTSLSMIEMQTRARRLKGQCPDLALLIIDYMQLMRGGKSKYDNRQQEVSEISRSIKGIAGELDVPVIALSQLSRQVEQRRGKNEKLPRLSDLRESGAIEQDADIVAFIHRERSTDLLANQQPEQVEEATLSIAKQRNGETGNIHLLFRGHVTLFVDPATN
jgi:replicative DNA helicase